MSFALTERQLLDGTKTVTRRLGWDFLKAGDELLAVRKCMGVPKGQKQHVLCGLRIADVRREPLERATLPGEAAREGFPQFTGAQFVQFFCHAMKCDPRRLVTRIEFVRLEAPPGTEYSPIPMGSAFRYTTQGPLRGPCGHKHKDIESAVDCLDADDDICISRGGHTDRKIFVVGPGIKRELNDDERAAVALYRSAPPSE